MRPIVFVPSLLGFAILALGACASGKPMESYSAATNRLAAECQARGGILIPTGQQSARANTDNACKITGGATRIPAN